MEHALGLNKSLTVDMRELAWIGNMSNSNLFIYTSPQSQTDGNRRFGTEKKGHHRSN